MRLAIILTIILIPLSLLAEPLYAFNWKTNIRVGNITIKSTYDLSNGETKKIISIYKNSKKLFFNHFENLICADNNFRNLNINIISSEQLRDRNLFRQASPTNFGRYYFSTNTIYIIYETFIHNEYLAHELAHYFYDKCGVKFRNGHGEHVKVYNFQKWYKERNYNGRSW